MKRVPTTKQSPNWYHRVLISEKEPLYTLYEPFGQLDSIMDQQQEFVIA